MNTLLLQFVALTSSVLLTLPPGWCRDSACLPAEAGPMETPCCQMANHGGPAYQGGAYQGGPMAPHQARAGTPEHAPPSDGECCCAWEATVPSTTLQPRALSGLLFPLISANILPDLRWRQTAPATHLLDRSGPRLHIWHCIWRC